MAAEEVFLIRHGETEWSLNGRHTGVTDIALTENGREVARHWRPYAAARTFALVLCSPLQRARQTCELAGLGAHAQIEGDLREWDYGDYEGLTPQQIRTTQPGWLIFRDGCPSGETPGQVGTRVDRVIARIRATPGDVALFAHGHVLRVFAARWLGLAASAGSHFLLETATLCVLSSYHGVPAVRRWNAPLVMPRERQSAPGPRTRASDAANELGEAAVSTRPSIVSASPAQAIRTGLAASSLQRAILDNLLYVQGRFPRIATAHDWYMALAYSVRDRLLARWESTWRTYERCEVKVPCYLSAEFLIGPQLGNNLVNLGILANAREAMAALDQDLDALLALEEEPGLGNGGLGRLAACYLDSLATLEVPAIGYGIRYEFGIFEQRFRDGAQIEVTDKWLQKGNPWEIMRTDVTPCVSFGGHTEVFMDAQGRYRVRWIPASQVKGVAFDTPVLGFRVNTCNTLRLWKSEAVESFDFQEFNVGDYYGAVQGKVISETLTKVLYPNDEPEIGKRLRLAQQYFFVSCSLQDMLRVLDLNRQPVTRLPEVFAVQLNDTHPSIAVAELMRLLIDERLLPWEQAWDLTQRTLAYTNHTLLPEALETWGLPLFRSLLPRPLEIVYEINRRFLEEVRQRYPGDDARLARLSLIDEAGEKRVRMANLATVGSHAVNGVAALHSKLLGETVLRDFAQLWPERFCNITNGVTPRRFMVLSNPALAQLLDETLGEGWASDLARLKALERRADDRAFRERWRHVKRTNKEVLARLIRLRTGMTVDPAALFDIQVKRIHEYKRQHLNALHIITLYNRLRNDPRLDVPPRCCIFGGKAAPGYHMAKLIIRLINGVAEVVNNDAAVAGRLKVVFFPNFNVKHSHAIYPAADLSEQISTAGKEASGTGNMKFMLNGALTIGTLDGANVEIREEAGAENFFLFGLTVEQAERVRREGYRPARELERHPELQQAFEQIAGGTFSHGDRELFKPLIDNLRYSDPFLVLADYADYVACQERVNAAWQDIEHWTRMSILNTARAGKFSSDRAVREYCDNVWSAEPVTIALDPSLS